MDIFIDILVFAVIGSIVSLPALFLYLKERKARIESEEVLEVVKRIGEIDDRIFRMRIDDPQDWPESREAQMLIAHRIKLHDAYSDLLGHQLLRDCDYVNELRGSVVSK